MMIAKKLIIHTLLVSASAVTAAYEAGACESLTGTGTIQCLTSSPCGDNNECTPTAGSCVNGQCMDVMGSPTSCETPTNKCGDVFCPIVTSGGKCFCDKSTCLQLQLPCDSNSWNGSGACSSGQSSSTESSSVESTSVESTSAESATATAESTSAAAYEAGACESLTGTGTIECLTSSPCGDNNECTPTAGSCVNGQCMDVLGSPTNCEKPTNKCGDVFCPLITSGGKCFCDKSTCMQLQLPCDSDSWNGSGACSSGQSGVVAGQNGAIAATQPLFAVLMCLVGSAALAMN